MTRNQLPEGVGKKIVEALKRQAEADITPLEENNNNIISNSLPLTNIEDVEEVDYSQNNEIMQEVDNDEIIEEETPSMPINTPNNTKDEIQINQTPVMQEKQIHTETPSFNFKEPIQRKEPVRKINIASTSINIPSNVAVLKNLIATLPVGVTKQTGAQIIRQTLEAMGIPMNSVLKEAQEVQEELNSSTRECMLKIQEYKTNILQLEQSVQEYQRNITQINDLVSLFLLTDKK